MINIKELSVGNWVNYRPGWKDEETGQIVYESGTGFPVKIEMIYFCHGEGLVQYNDGQNDGIEACDYELFPIPITPEILEKSGFYEDEDGVWGDDNSYFIPTYSSGFAAGTWETHIEPTEGIGDFGGELKYVHQLQNALTLCGINKEIEL